MAAFSVGCIKAEVITVPVPPATIVIGGTYPDPSPGIVVRVVGTEEDGTGGITE